MFTKRPGNIERGTSAKNASERSENEKINWKKPPKIYTCTYVYMKSTQNGKINNARLVINFINIYLMEFLFHLLIVGRWAGEQTKR